MELIRNQCISCGNCTPESLSDSGECQLCGSQAQLICRCAWCSHWSLTQDYCDNCGSVIATESKYGASRILKRKGRDQVSISIELDKYSSEQLQELSDEYQAHLDIATQLIRTAGVCANYLFNPRYLLEFEDRLAKELPFDKDTFSYFSSNALPKDVTTSIDINSIAQNCKYEEIKEIAIIVSIKYPDAIFDSSSAKGWLERVTEIAFSDSINAIEALIALTHWRSWLAPFYFNVYQEELGRKIYNIAYAKFNNSDGDQASWIAALCAKTAYYKNLSASDKTRQMVNAKLKNGLTSEDLDLKISCAVLLNEDSVFAELLKSDDPAILAISVRVLTRNCSDHLVALIEQANPTTITLILDGIANSEAKRKKDIPKSIINALYKIIERLESELVNQVICLIAENTQGDEVYFKDFVVFLNQYPDQVLAVDLLSEIYKTHPNEMQQLLLSVDFNREHYVQIEQIARANNFRLDFADKVVRAMRRNLLENAACVDNEIFASIISLQMSVDNPSAYVFKRFVLEGIMLSRPELSNKMYSLIKDNLLRVCNLNSMVDTNNNFYSSEFCDNYFGSTDSLLAALKTVLLNRKDYQCHEWLLQTLFSNARSLKILLAQNADYAKSIFNSMVIIYSEADESKNQNPEEKSSGSKRLEKCDAEENNSIERDLKKQILEFIFSPIGAAEDEYSPFYDVIEVSDFEAGLMSLLSTASERYLFSRTLLIESLQYFELSRNKEYLEQIQVILNNQCAREPSFSYYCISYLIRNSFNTDNVELANDAYSILSFINSTKTVYLGPKDNIVYKLSDLGNFIRNYFTKLEDFTDLFDQLIRSDELFGMELWLLSSFHRNANLVISRYSNKDKLLAKIIISVAAQTISGKYNNVSQSIITTFFTKFLSCLPINEYVLTATLEVLDNLEVGADSSERLREQLNFVISEFEKTSEANALVSNSSRSESNNISSSQFLENVQFNAAPIDIDFEVSLSWISRFGKIAKSVGLSKLLPVLGLFHNHSQAFKAMLRDELESAQSVLDQLIALIFMNLDDESNDLVSQKLILSELIIELSLDSRLVHQCIGSIKERLLTLPEVTPHIEYVQRTLDQLCEMNIDKIPARVNHNDSIVIENKPVKRRIPNYSQLEINFDLEELKQQFPHEALWLCVKRGVSLIVSHDYIGAINQFKSMLDIEQTDRVYYLIAKAYLLYDLPEQATKFIEKCLVLNPFNWQALTLYAFQQEFINNNIEFAETLMKRAYEINPKSDRVLVRISSINLKRNKHTVAMSFIKEALTLKSKNPEVFFLLGELLQKTKRYKESIRYYRKAVELGANDSCVFSAIGVSEFRLGNVVDGVKQLKQALEIEPDCAIAHSGLGEIYGLSGDLKKAESHLLQACEFDSTNNTYRMSLAEYYQSIGENEKALEMMISIASEGDSTPSSLIQLAHLCVENNRLLDAQDYLEKAISLQPENYTLYFELAQLYETTQALGNAVGILQRVIEIKPDFIDARLKMAGIYAHLERSSEAEKCYHDILLFDEKNSKALMGIGELYSLAGDKVKADQFFQKAKQE